MSAGNELCNEHSFVQANAQAPRHDITLQFPVKSGFSPRSVAAGALVRFYVESKSIVLVGFPHGILSPKTLRITVTTIFLRVSISVQKVMISKHEVTTLRRRNRGADNSLRFYDSE